MRTKREGVAGARNHLNLLCVPKTSCVLITGLASRLIRHGSARTSVRAEPRRCGRNLVIDYRSAEGQPDRFPALASELVGLKADLITTRGTPAFLAAKNATSTIPVVMTAIGEAVQTGVVASIARPGGNITGLSSFVLDVSSKRLELMSEMVRSLRRIGYLSELNNAMSQLEWNNVQKAAQSLRVETHPLDVRRTADFGHAFNLAVEPHDDALI